MTYPNYLSAHRKRWALTKKELAHLIGYYSHHAVSRCETELRQPGVRLVLGCEVVFGLPARRLFPAFYSQVEDLVMERAALLDQSIRDRDDAGAQRKRDLLKDMVERAQSHPLV